MSRSRSNSSKSSSHDNRRKSIDKQQKHLNKERSYPQKHRYNNSHQRSRSKSYQRNVDRNSYNSAKNSKLFVTNIQASSNKEQLQRQLKKQFQKYGQIKEIIIKTKQGSFNSFAFIQYQHIQEAQKALNQMKGKQFRGKQLKVQFGKGQKKDQDRRTDKCYICHRQGHFARDCRYQDRDQRNYRDRKYNKDRNSYRRRHSGSSSQSYNRRHRRSRSYDRDNRRSNYRRSPQMKDYSRRQRY